MLVGWDRSAGAGAEPKPTRTLSEVGTSITQRTPTTQWLWIKVSAHSWARLSAHVHRANFFPSGLVAPTEGRTQV